MKTKKELMVEYEKFCEETISTPLSGKCFH